MNETILFPGQGAQYEGMGRDWAEADAVARATWEEADRILGFPLSEKAWSSGEEVHRTDIAQPAIFVTSVAVIRVLEERGYDRFAAPFTAGLSLGEYTALWAAGALEFADGLRLVRLRGEAMQAASEAKASGMLSLMGADLEQAEALALVGAEHGICQVANRNAPGQIVLSGELAALDAAQAAAAEHGVRRTRRLVVAGGFHSECMRPAADALARALAETAVEPPRLPVLSNVTGEPVGEDPERIRELLARQVCAPVLWQKSMQWLLDHGQRRFLEPAPGRTLAGILRKIDPEAEVRNLAGPADLEPAS